MRNTPFKTVVISLLTINLYLIPLIGFTQEKEQETLDRAWEFYDNHEYEACLKELENLPFDKGQPGAGPYYLLGLCKYELGDYQGSIESFGTSLKKDPKMVENYFDRGYSYWAISRYKEAAADFKMSLKGNSGKKKDQSFINQTAANYAYCLGESGEQEEAIRYLEKYRNKNGDLLHILAYYTSEYLKDAEKAIMYWEQALQIERRHLQSLEDLSITYSEVGDYNMAFYHIEKLIEYYPDYARGYYLKGVYLEETGEDGDAERYFKLAREKGYDPDTNE
jgi:tetratricopeptide (TPR) repeat protein